MQAHSKPEYTHQVSIQHQTAFINVWFLCSPLLTFQNVIYRYHTVSYHVSVGQIMIIIGILYVYKKQRHLNKLLYKTTIFKHKL